MKRGLWLTAALLFSFVASTATAQQELSDSPRTLGERLSQFRLGWPGGDEQQPPQRSTNPQAGRNNNSARSKFSSSLPRVNSRSLLPDDLNNGRGAAPSPPRVASLPERYQRDSQNPSTSTVPSGRQNAVTPARPSAATPVRRSPFQSPRHEFDAAELRRDLVGTNAPSTGTAAVSNKEPALGTTVDTTTASPTQPPRSISDRNSAPETETTVASPQGAVEALPRIKSTASPAVIVSQPVRPMTPAPAATLNATSRNNTIEAPQGQVTSQSDLRTLFQNESSDTGPSATASMPIPGDVLMSQKMPQIVSHVSGPRQIVVGREATYKVWIANRGELAADDLSTRVKVPAWAELKKVTVSTGALDRQQGDGEMRWQIAKLDAQKFETLEVVLVAKESKPIELGVDWTHAPVDSRTLVEVREPKLAMTVTGPEEVLYGKPQLYRLTLSNPGTAAAEDLTIVLLPPGGDSTKASSHPFGSLAAGETKTAEVELTARDAGKLFVKATATAAGGLTAAAEQEIFCRKPELEVDWRGPERKYAGTQATYYFRIRNPGTAPAEGVSFQVELPKGFEVVEANGSSAVPNGQPALTWKLNTLEPGDDHYLELKGTVKQAGANEFRFTAASQDGLVKNAASMTTNVEALADLKLQVSDPTGPVAVGEEAVYEIRVHNHGTSEARQVTVAALFSDGIEPQTADGDGHTIADGRVAFHGIEKLPAGEEVTLRVRARGVSAGTHLFRAEVVCGDLEIKLAAEETTRFYADDVSPLQTANENAGAAPASAGSRYTR
ncbi:MAG: hypothetical protein WD851_23170 [Pirellulales bacterium]